MKKNKILVICGPSGSGKTYKEKELNDLSPIGNYYFKKLKQVTTREMREEERINGSNYIFVSKEEYDILKNNLFAKTEINGNYYGTKIPLFNEDKNVIHTVVANKKGIDDIREYVNNHKDLDIDLRVILILSDEPTKRDDRDSEYVEEEKNLLLKESNFDLLFINKPETDDYVSVDDIYEGLIRIGMIE